MGQRRRPSPRQCRIRGSVEETFSGVVRAEAPQVIIDNVVVAIACCMLPSTVTVVVVKVSLKSSVIVAFDQHPLLSFVPLIEVNNCLRPSVPSVAAIVTKIVGRCRRRPRQLWIKATVKIVLNALVDDDEGGGCVN